MTKSDSISEVRSSKRALRFFDLEERCARVAENVIDLCRDLPRGPLTNRLIDQLVGAGSSIGANYAEANDTTSKRDFKHRIGICRKESRESMHFLRLVAKAEPVKADTARRLWQEARELNLIFGSIFRGSSSRQ